MALTRQEILDKIGQYEKGLSNPKLPDATKAAMVNKIEALKKDAEALEEKIEKKEEKKEEQEKKSIADLKAKVAQYEKGLSNPKLPEATKSSMKKMIAKIEQDIKEQEKEVKEDKKESEQEKKEVKKAIQEVEKVAKRKTPIKRTPIAPKIKIQEKKREVKQEKRQGKIKEIMTDLQKLVEKNKELREKYKGKGVDLEKDAGRSAKPFGYRFVGKHDYRVPTEAQVKAGKKRGTIDYEARPNRSDKYPKATAKLAKGGDFEKVKLKRGNPIPEWVVTVTSKSGDTYDWRGQARNEDDALRYAEEEAGFESVETGINMITDERGKSIEYAKGGGISSKYSKIKREYEENEDENAHSENVVLLAKHFGTESELKEAKSILQLHNKEGHLSTENGKKRNELHMKLIAKARKEMGKEGVKFASGGTIHSKKKDAQRFAKPKGWRWKNEAVTDGIIKKASLSKTPSLKMRKEYPDYVAYEDRASKSDKKPSRKYKSL